jgi:BolA protein
VTGTRSERLASRLKSALSPETIEIVDDSHLHAGHHGAADGRGHFSVLVVSERFRGLPTVRRHRLVYEAVGDMMTTDIHALSIQALAPGETTVS